ncbi:MULTISPECIES: type III secretion system stator protein SctL [Mycetohabitans]|uniref:type III secretion system stator protein SctL n=1 Tax=Mycetohabitans TaxID=2571159 RepID=UPI001E2FCC27|nr:MULTISPECIES: type III secretion system stator protein SctL [Mycetohabitans]
MPETLVARVGAGSDIIPAQEFGALMTIEQAYAQLEADRRAAIERAEKEAAALIDAAHDAAQQILDDAKREYETAAERGYQEGEQRALSEWMERLAELADGERRMQVRMRERLAQIVTVGVEQIVQVQHSDALFERALEVVDRIVEGAAYVRVVVSEMDHDKACVAFERLAVRWREMGCPFPLTVVADRQLPAGSCICESDFGSIDASLATQLRAMRTAITRTLKRSLVEMEETGKGTDRVAQSDVRLSADGDEDQLGDDVCDEGAGDEEILDGDLVDDTDAEEDAMNVGEDAADAEKEDAADTEEDTADIGEDATDVEEYVADVDEDEGELDDDADVVSDEWGRFIRGESERAP